MDAAPRQVIAFHVSDYGGQSAQALWEKLPAVDREYAVFYTDPYVVYSKVIPSRE